MPDPNTKPVDLAPPGEPCELKVGGITPLTSIDYPGELAAVVFCQGCPWHCVYCQNGHLLRTRQTAGIDWSEILEFLSRRSGLLDAVVFSGGEPTLQAALPEAIRRVKQMGFKIGLHTAGCYPKRLGQVLHLVDWVGLDIKGLPDQYPKITQVPGSGQQAWESLEAIQAAGVDYEVRTTRMPGTPDAQLVSLSRILATKDVRQYALQTCQTHDTLEPGLKNMLDNPPAKHIVEQLQRQIPRLVLR